VILDRSSHALEGARVEAPGLSTLLTLDQCRTNRLDLSAALLLSPEDEMRRRIADTESGKVRGIPLDETLAKARKIIGRSRSS
jgi:hypothetical protein